MGIFGKISTYLLHQYTNLSIAPKKRHNSDWYYPIDFWTGKDGSEAKQNTIIEKSYWLMLIVIYRERNIVNCLLLYELNYDDFKEHH